VSVRNAASLPARLLPILYLSLAHASLSLAFTAVALEPQSVAGFFYHSRMIALVHMVTIGWITASILGALYLVAPLALKTTLPARWPDYVAAALFWIGAVGMVAHFWIAGYGGMAWSGAMVACGVLIVGVRVMAALHRSAIPFAVRMHIGLAFLNFAGAATAGVLLGIHKVYPFLPGSLLSNVFAHAHVAALGWAVLMVVGVGYRLFPMVLPAQMPSGPTLFVTAGLIQAGVWGLFLTLVGQTGATAFFAALIVGGIAAFAGHIIWMLRHPRPKPPAIRTPDPAVLHAAAALASLAIACVLGLWLAAVPMSPATLRAAMAYGVFGLIGFLAQIVVAMEGRLLPLAAWYWAFGKAGGTSPIVPPHARAWRTGQLTAVALWWFGVPCLAVGLASATVPLVTVAAWSLLVATLLDAAQIAIVVRR